MDGYILALTTNLTKFPTIAANLFYGPQGYHFNDYCNWQRIKPFRDFVFETEIGQAAALFLRSKYAVFYHDHVLNKEPGQLFYYLSQFWENFVCYVFCEDKIYKLN